MSTLQRQITRVFFVKSRTGVPISVTASAGRADSAAGSTAADPAAGHSNPAALAAVAAAEADSPAAPGTRPHWGPADSTAAAAAE
jgi:hypothetical protein